MKVRAVVEDYRERNEGGRINKTKQREDVKRGWWVGGLRYRCRTAARLNIFSVRTHHSPSPSSNDEDPHYVNPPTTQVCEDKYKLYK